MSQELPAGLELGEKISGENGFGDVFELSDRRLVADCALKRVIRILPMPDTAADNVTDHVSDSGWRSSFRIQLQALLRQTLPYVSTPREAGTLKDGREYLICDHEGIPLSARLCMDEGLARREVETWLTELLTGLASLHARGISHGDLRPSNICIEEGPKGKHVRIADAAVGPATWWSKGRIRQGDAARYYPPEWQGQTHQPEPRTDLYALGLLVCEMLLGKAAVSSINGNDPAWTQLRPKLGGVRHSVKGILQRLLDPVPENRPADAVAALQEFRKLERHETQLWLKRAIAAAVLALFATMGWAWTTKTSLNEQIKEATSQRARDSNLVEDLKTQVMTAGNTINSLSGENTRLIAENTELRAKLPEPLKALDPELVEAQKLWAENLDPALDSTPQLYHLFAALGLDGKKEVPKAIKGLHLAWYGATRSVYMDARDWFPSDPELKSRYRVALTEPWIDDHRRQARQRLQVLKSAASTWHDWAVDDGKSWADVEKLIDNPAKFDAATQVILKGWQKALLDRSSKPFVLQLKTGKAPADWGTTREVGVKGQGDWKYNSPHDWKSETSHTYLPGIADSKIQFQWKPGIEIGICLYGEYRARTVYTKRPLHLEQVFVGPLALWRMHDEGRAERDGFVLEFEIVDCPGPPPRLKSLTSMAERILTGDSPTRAELKP